jgi:CheY-like chemotaxis protein
VLIVDDAKTNRRILRRVLEKSSHRVDEASNGQEALDRSASNHYDLMITDINMPGMDGYELVQHVRAGIGCNASMPIVALSGCVTDSERQHAHEVGVNAYLAKPLDFDELAGVIQAL